MSEERISTAEPQSASSVYYRQWTEAERQHYIEQEAVYQREIDDRWAQAERWDTERIVRELAQLPEPIEDEYGQCMLCDRSHRGKGLNIHEPTCPWRQAVAWHTDNQ